MRRCSRLSCSHEVEHVDLVGDVEERRRLVEQQEVGLLRKRHCDPHPLALPARQLVDRAVGEFHRRGGFQRRTDRALVGFRPLLEELLMGRATTGHEIDDQDALGCDRRLREQPEPAGDLLGGQAVDLLAVEDHVPGARAQQAGEGAQEGRLAAGVGSDDHGDLAVGHRQRERRR